MIKNDHNNIKYKFLLLILLSVFLLCCGKEAQPEIKDYVEDNTNGSEQQSNASEEYVPYLDINPEIVGFLETNKAGLQKVGFSMIEDETADLDVFKIFARQKIYSIAFPDLSYTAWMEIYDGKLDLTVESIWIYPEQASIKQAYGEIYSCILDYNVSPRKYSIHDGAKNYDSLFWKINDGYLQFVTISNGTDNWPEWKVLMCCYVKSVSQFKHYAESEQFYVDLDKYNNSTNIGSEYKDSYYNQIEIENEDIEDIIKKWGYDGTIYSGGVPENIFNRLKGNYSVDKKIEGYEYSFISPDKIMLAIPYDDGSYKYYTIEESFVGEDGKLYLHLIYDDYFKQMVSIPYTDNDADFILEIWEGDVENGWNIEWSYIIDYAYRVSQ